MPVIKRYIERAITPAGQAVAIHVEVPNECPLCHYHVDPKLVVARFLHEFPTQDIYLQATYQCSRNACRNLFIASYTTLRRAYWDASDAVMAEVTLTRVAPKNPKEHAFDQAIKEVSPFFVTIFNQAAAAEDAGLAEIAGPGYGKALEFLIKDYLIAKDRSSEAEIKREFLGRVIDRVADERVKAMAKRAAWLRNDETHYERRLEGKDINDLKKLITLTVNWVHNSLLTEEAIEDLPDAKGSGSS